MFTWLIGKERIIYLVIILIVIIALISFSKGWLSK
jgi:hypothetical protein